MRYCVVSSATEHPYPVPTATHRDMTALHVIEQAWRMRPSDAEPAAGLIGWPVDRLRAASASNVGPRNEIDKLPRDVHQKGWLNCKLNRALSSLALCCTSDDDKVLCGPSACNVRSYKHTCSDWTA